MGSMQGMHARAAQTSVVSRTIITLTLVGILMFLALIMEFSAPQWSRLALVLQGVALVLGLAFVRQRHIRQMLFYPLLVGVSIYLWDMTLPPPTLPEGLLREAVPRLVVLGLLAHLVFMFLQRRPPQYRAVAVIGGYIELDGAALIFGRDPTELRRELLVAGCQVHVTQDGQERIALTDLQAYLARTETADA